MIAYLRGEVLSFDHESLVLDVQGVGYEIFCSQTTLDVMSSATGPVGVYIYTHLREEALQLYGFYQLPEKQLFLALTKVNGVGPKMAMKILSGAHMDQIMQMIDEGDAKGLSGLPKVGKKTAEQIILSLKGKLVFSDEAKGKPRSGTRQEIISALVNLGYRLNDAEKVVAQMDAEIDIQEGVREGLRILSANF